MCGFTGFVSHNAFDDLKQDLPDASNSLSQRGPDDSGLFFDKTYGVGLAHRRLSIIDLTKAGHQPMANEDQTMQIVYNGEIYNFMTIRAELKELGYKFHSATDTEVVLNAYREWGPECLDKFIGMFALAIWDQPQKRIFLARDRLGIKPLYYYFRNNTLIFGSELKALMAFRQFPRDIDADAVPLFLHFQYIPAPRTIFKNTFKLPPGNFLLFDGNHTVVKPYWSIPDSRISTFPKEYHNENKMVGRLDQILTQAVSDRLVSDVPLGALLSGGIDSSIVAALMQKVNPVAVKTFSIGFGEKGYNEAPWAQKVASYLGTDHTELYVDSQQVMDVIPYLSDIYDEPFADSSAIPTFLVSRLIRKHVTVALSGDGGDEQFAGYVRYWMTCKTAKWMKRLPIGYRKLAGQLLNHLPTDWIERCYLPVRDCLPKRLQIANVQDKWQKFLSLLMHDRLSELYRRAICIWDTDDIMRLTDQSLPECRFDEIFNETQAWPSLQRLMYVDQHSYLPDAMLTKVDRASMANGLEVRVPLLDHRVVEFTAQLPEHLKLRDGSGKYLLKKVLRQYIPNELVERPKMGFGVPIAQWLKGPLKTLLYDYLSADRLKREGLFDQTFISKKIKEHQSGKYNHQHRLWSLLIWQMWRERWLNQ